MTTKMVKTMRVRKAIPDMTRCRLSCPSICTANLRPRPTQKQKQPRTIFNVWSIQLVLRSVSPHLRVLSERGSPLANYWIVARWPLFADWSALLTIGVTHPLIRSPRYRIPITPRRSLCCHTRCPGLAWCIICT